MNINSIFGIIIIGTIIIVGLQYIIENQKYKNSEYGKNSKKTFFEIIHDKGAKGEYKTSYNLEKTKYYKKFIYNCYIQNYQNELTEIDIIMISEKGIYVIENKNYNGWIFGDEKSKNWCQIIQGKKYFFYNPIKQNKSHIKNLNKMLKENEIKSLIIFNKNAELKKISVESKNTYVINTEDIDEFFSIENKKNNIYSKNRIDEIYNTLLPYTKISDDEKRKHIERIKYKNL